MKEAAKSRACLLWGVAFMFGGETLCIFGPLRYQPLVHVVCHAIFYSGMALCFWGAFLYARSRRAGRMSLDSPPASAQKSRPLR